jgi:hypothetical protein
MTTPDVITWLDDSQVFVFGSNMAGRHGKGAALDAYRKFGAIWGAGYGLMGKSFAIPTKNYDLDPMPLPEISFYVRNFVREAIERHDLTFLVTPIGCGLAGYKPSQIAPMFLGSPKNCVFPTSFQLYLS